MDLHMYGAPGTIDDYTLWGVITLRASSRFALRAAKFLLWSGSFERATAWFVVTVVEL